MRYFIIFLFTLVFFSSCKKQEDDIITLSNVEYIDFGSCFLEFRIDDEQVLITDSATYADLEKALRSPWNPLDFTDSCRSVSLPYVDFSTSFVVGKFTSGTGCDATYARSIIYNKTQNHYTYTINANYTGVCTLEISSYNWVVVPALGKEFTISFNIK